MFVKLFRLSASDSLRLMILTNICMAGVMLFKWTLGLVHLERMVCVVIGSFVILELVKS